MIDKIAAAASSAAAGPTAGSGFDKALPAPHGRGVRASVRPSSTPERVGADAVEPGSRLEVVAPPAQRPGGARILGEVEKAQVRLDQLLKMAESGRTFSPAELLAFQAHAFRASQELDLAGKVVEKGTSAVKQTLQTQL